MPTYLPPIVWSTPSPCEQQPSSVPDTATIITTEPPDVTIVTVRDFIEAHGLEPLMLNPGLNELPIGAVKVEHDSVAQLTYFLHDGTVVGSASWPMQPEGPETYAGRGQRIQPNRGTT